MTLIEPPLMSWALLIGRICLAMPFLVSGLHKGICYRKALEEFRVARVGFVEITLPATVALHLTASICLILGIFVAESALLLAVFTMVATIKVHHFWRMSGMQRLVISRVAMANLGVVGGLLIVAVTGPGRFALGWPG
ncbi:MAG: DoxX family protein [Gammaproteobacteria bacterium]|nr:DoxX family protein [Gammaproteobacteria bacterium]MDH3429922.1 DoxX family protein [Gammaproteobacteria bacterium]MDH3434158.1 DoxX family protein [Gammaproteobacteria bacterium]